MVKIQNCTPNQFIKQTKGKRMICICAGENFKTFCNNYQVLSQIDVVVDNLKKGTIFKINGREIPVISIEQLEPEQGETVLVLTSVKVADELLPQLDQKEQLNDMVLYVPEMFEREKRNYIYGAERVEKIPKVIHYCWFGKNPLPKRFMENIDSWKACCPDYEIKQWNEDNYDLSKNKYMRQAYEKKKWGFVPDYARLDIIASYGGIYLDTDVKMMKCFDPLLQFGLFCGFESQTRINFGQGFGARKGHPALEELRKEYEECDFINADGTFNTIPSPVYQTKTLERLGFVIDGNLQQRGDMIVLPVEFFSPINEFGYGLPTRDTFSVHQYEGSWYDEEQRKVKERVIRNYQYLAGRGQMG